MFLLLPFPLYLKVRFVIGLKVKELEKKADIYLIKIGSKIKSNLIIITSHVTNICFPHTPAPLGGGVSEENIKTLLDIIDKLCFKLLKLHADIQ